MKFAICQELFVDWSWERQCRFIADVGYTGIEIAPFTLADRVTNVTAEQRQTLRKQAEDAGLDTVKVEVLGETVHLNAAEVKQIERDINSQIYARDFALIDQADMIVSFIPELDDGMPALSSGVERELQHAHEAAKEVFVIWMPKKEPSVFITQTANKIFRSPEEALMYFQKQYEYKSPMLFD